jgi:hypothetical protein
MVDNSEWRTKLNLLPQRLNKSSNEYPKRSITSTLYDPCGNVCKGTNRCNSRDNLNVENCDPAHLHTVPADIRDTCSATNDVFNVQRKTNAAL